MYDHVDKCQDFFFLASGIKRFCLKLLARPVRGQAVASGAISPSTHDPYAGMKTPGQRQLIALQERVKVGAMSVDEAVQEFKAWQFDQERRSNSIRFQQVNSNN